MATALMESGEAISRVLAPSLSVVILCFNEELVVHECVTEAIQTLRPLSRDLQVVIVEDGSTDGTHSILQDLARCYPEIEIVCHKRNLGYGTSLSHGIHAARNEYVLCVDGDRQFDFGDAKRFLELAESYEIIGGCREPRADAWHRRATGWLYNQVVRRTLALQIKDVDCGFKLFRRSAACALFPTKSTFAVWAEAMTRAERLGYRCASINIRHLPRETGKSKVFNFHGVSTIILEVIRLAVRSRLRKI